MTYPTYEALEIVKLPEGGFMVKESNRGDGYYVSMLFASSTIEEALKFMKVKLTK